MKTLRLYWRRLSKEERQLYANKIGISVIHIENKYVCKDPARRQMPSTERKALFVKESNGEVTVEGLAFDFVIEPVLALISKK